MLSEEDEEEVEGKEFFLLDVSDKSYIVFLVFVVVYIFKSVSFKCVRFIKIFILLVYLSLVVVFFIMINFCYFFFNYESSFRVFFFLDL